MNKRKRVSSVVDKFLNEASPIFRASRARVSRGSENISSEKTRVGDLDVVKGSFKGTSTDRARLRKDLAAKIEKIKASGKEDTLPKNWQNILNRSDGDELAALEKEISPGIFKKMGRFFGLGENTLKFTEKQLRRLIRESIIREANSPEVPDVLGAMGDGKFQPRQKLVDPTEPIHIDDLEFVDDEGYGAMMFPGEGFSYTVREKDFEAQKAKLKARYGNDVMISTPNPSYPKVRKIHSDKFEKSKNQERQNFNRHQKMMAKRLGREPGLGT